MNDDPQDVAPSARTEPPNRDHTQVSDVPKNISGDSLFRFVFEAGLFTAYLSAVLFIAGWSYADRYFAIFGINISALNAISGSSFYAYSFWVFRDYWGISAIFAMFGLGAVAILLVRQRLSRFPKALPAIFLAVVAISGLLGSGYLGRIRADIQVPRLLSEHYQTFPRIVLHAKPSSAIADFLKSKGGAQNSTCLRKLFMDRQNIYVYPGYESLRTQIPPVYIVPLKDITAVEIIMNRGLCSP